MRLRESHVFLKPVDRLPIKKLPLRQLFYGYAFARCHPASYSRNGFSRSLMRATTQEVPYLGTGIPLGHNAHSRNGCLMRPAKSPASLPQPIK